ncbi:MAG: long-chain fatty acid--CoA ligase [Enterovirga sp.]|nr:long-chain fatty acid--CoA ligase [Enterovirga sp.]
MSATVPFGTSALRELTLPQILRHRAETAGDALAFREKVRGVWRRTTWAQYHATARRLAIALYSRGFRPGDRLAVASENIPEWMYADLAAQMVGGACLGIYPTNPWPELQYILRQSRTRFVVCGDQEQTDKVIDASASGEGLPDLDGIITVDAKGMRHYAQSTLMSFSDLLCLGERHEAEFGTVVDDLIEKGRPDDVAIVVYTSGTTGMPKGAMLTHRNMVHAAAEVVDIAGLTADTYSIVCYLPLCHVAERSFSTCMHLITGCTISFAESIDTVVANLREIAPRGFLGVPRIWEKMQQGVVFRMRDATPLQRRVFETCMARGRGIAERRLRNGGGFASLSDRVAYTLLWVTCFRSLKKHLGLDRVRAGFCGGATISAEVLLFFWILGVPVYQIYGMTETGGVTHMQRPGFTELGTAGLLVGGLEQRVDSDGELLVRGPSVFKGYLFDEEASGRALADGGWLRTGDIVEFTPDRQLRVVDRKKDILITSGGKNITPSLIENALKDSVYVREAILLGDGRHFLSALIQIDFDTVGQWAREKGIPYTTYRTLAENASVRELIEAEVAQVNARFARVENIRKFVILAKELDHDDGEMTATMKVRRRIIEQRFRSEIVTIYGEAA